MARCLRLTGLLALALTSLAPPLMAGALDTLEQLTKPGHAAGTREFLPPDQAFVLRSDGAVDGALRLHWDIQPGYYLYRDKMKFLPQGPGLTLGAPRLPDGEIKDDPEFGEVHVFKHAADVAVPFTADGATADTVFEIEARYMGCAEDGICYPPIKKKIAFSPGASGAGPAAAAGVAGAATAGGSAVSAATRNAAASTPLPESDRIARTLAGQSLVPTLALFLGFGLLLSFTPCVLPMVPILSGIIVGQQQPVGARRGFLLSATYVVAMAATYAAAGVAAALLGRNLQAAFQAPAVLIAFSAVFVALALSMFGFYELQLPAVLQSRLDRVSRAQHSGSYAGAAVMGVLSALIVGPCVAPPLAGALIYIGQQGSALVGASALFALGIGMGVPLLALGLSAGGLLPRAGRWMVAVKQAFGVVFLGVAITFLARILPGPAVLALWALLAIGTAVFLGALEVGAGPLPARRRLQQGLGITALVYGAALLVGAAAGADDPLAPLAPFAGGRVAAAAAGPAFIDVTSVEALDRELARAQGAGRPVMLDFYADWCVECKHLERDTFPAPTVAARLADYALLRADVTADDPHSQALLARFELLGPPAVLFFAGGRELREFRVTGFLDAAGFAAHLASLPAGAAR